MRILHLYHDIMNLYGEYGNIRALTRMLEKSEIAYELECLSVTDELSLLDYDFIYVGSGTESNQKYILQHLSAYQEELRRYIDLGKLLLMTGNSFEILGEKLIDAKGKEYRGLGLFSFRVKEQDKTRNTADAIFTMKAPFIVGDGHSARLTMPEAEGWQFTMKELEQPLVGFINKCSTIEGISTPLFTVKMGLGNEGPGGSEGIRCKNFFGTHLTGPVLVKNPYFLIYLTKILCTNVERAEMAFPASAAETKDDRGQAGAGVAIETKNGGQVDAGADDDLHTSWLTYELAGYEVTLRELSKRLAESS